MPKILKPTLRERNRYLLFEVLSDGTFDRKPVVDAVWASLLRLHGELGASKTSLWVMDWEKEKKKGILKVNHKSIDTLRSSAALVKEVGGKKATINVTRVAGTLKAARERL
jgi:ribonuclease P/MRP protein subunit POP5